MDIHISEIELYLKGHAHTEIHISIYTCTEMSVWTYIFLKVNYI